MLPAGLPDRGDLGVGERGPVGIAAVVAPSDDPLRRLRIPGAQQCFVKIFPDADDFLITDDDAADRNFSDRRGFFGLF